MSMVNLHDCIRNTAGLIPLTAIVKPTLLLEPGKELNPPLIEDLIPLKEFLIQQEIFSNAIEWSLEIDGFKLWAGVEILKLDFSEWRNSGGEERLMDVIVATITQCGNWVYKREIEQIEKRLCKNISTHPRIQYILKCAKEWRNCD